MKQIKCEYCEKLHNNKKFCSIKCQHKYFKKYKISAFYNPILKKEISIKGGKAVQKKYPKMFKQLGKNVGIKYGKVGGKIGGKIGGKKAAITHKKNKTNFWNSEFQSKAGKIGGKRTHELHPNQAKEWGKKVAEKNRKNKTSCFFDKKLQSKLGRIGGFITIRKLRENIKNLKYNKNYYDSMREIEISLCLQKQFNYNPIERKTLHIRIGRYEYDYLLNKLFIEFHIWFQNETEQEYFNRKRKNLDMNGYKKYPLIVIK